MIVNDAIMSQFTTIAFGEEPESLNLGDEDVRNDVLVIQDTAEVTNSDLSNVSGLEVIESPPPTMVSLNSFSTSVR